MLSTIVCIFMCVESISIWIYFIILFHILFVPFFYIYSYLHNVHTLMITFMKRNNTIHIFFSWFYFCIHCFLYLFGSCFISIYIDIIDYSSTFFIYLYIYFSWNSFSLLFYILLLCFNDQHQCPQEGIKKVSHEPNLMLFDTFSLDVNVFSV